MKVLFYLDRLMHYHEAVFQEIEKRLERNGGTFIVLSGCNGSSQETGRVALSKTVVKRQVVVPFYEWQLSTYTIRWQPTLRKVVRQIAPDVLIVMGHVGSPTYWRLGWRRKQLTYKYVTWQCGYEYNPNWVKRVLTRTFLKRYDHHLAYHTEAKRYLLTHGVEASRVTVIHNTIDEREIHLLPRATARKKVTNELGLPLDRPIVLYVGAILAEKRLSVLIDAVRLLEPGALSIVIVGDGPALSELKSLSANLDCVKYTGRIINGVGRFFDAADIFVLPGTGGLAINEAMAHGLPIITGNADGSAQDLVADGVNGYLLKQEDAQELATCLKKLLRDPQRRSELGSASRQLITTKYTFNNFIDCVIEGLNAAAAAH